MSIDRLEQFLEDLGEQAGIASLASLSPGVGAPPVRADARKHIAFEVGGEGCLLPFHAMREVIALPRITPVPRADESVAGIASLRGDILAIFDLRAILGLERQTPGASARVLVLRDSTSGLVGLLADKVLGTLAVAEIEALRAGASDLLVGIARAKERLYGVIDVNRLLTRIGVET